MRFPGTHYLGTRLVVVSPGELLATTKTASQEILETALDQVNPVPRAYARGFGAPCGE